MSKTKKASTAKLSRDDWHAYRLKSTAWTDGIFRCPPIHVPQVPKEVADEEQYVDFTDRGRAGR